MNKLLILNSHISIRIPKNIRSLRNPFKTQQIKSIISMSTTQEAESTNNITSNTSSTYRKPTSPSGVPLSQVSTKLFPLSFNESFQDYKTRKEILKIQDELLSTLPFYPEPSKTHSSEIKQFKSPNSLLFPDINEFHVKPLNPTEKDKHLVIIHGYGAGLGFFIKNIEKLSSEYPDWNIHAIDLPGYGCSTRVKFPFNIPNNDYKLVEKLFTIPLSDWYKFNKLNNENSITVAHSMGGYFSLLLQMNEINGENFINEREFEILKNKNGFFNRFSKDNIELNLKFQNQLKELSKTNENPTTFWNSLILVSPGGIHHENSHEIEAKIPTWFSKLWNLNVSPFSLVRNTGPLGSYFVSGWTSRRFSINNLFNDETIKLLHKYSYAIFNAKGSGEYMLNYLLSPGALPKNPLLNRIESLKFTKFRSIWLYGSNDWMDFNGGIKSCEKLNNINLKNGKLDNSNDSIFEIVPGAGHHIYLDAFNKFNEIVGNEMNFLESKKSN